MNEPTTTETATFKEPAQTEIQAFYDPMTLGQDVNLIGVLQETQDRFGYLPRAALRELGRRCHIPLARIYGVVSFYAQFYTEPHGKHTILCCRGTACHVKGAMRVIDAVEEQLGVKEGQSTPDMMFYLETVACLGTCFLAPVMMIDTQYYGMLTPKKVAKVLKSHRQSAVASAKAEESA